MPNKPSILDMMRNDMEMNETVPPQSPERALTPTVGYPYDYPMDEPPVIQRITETPLDTLPHTQNLLRSVHALGRLRICHAHGLHLYRPLRIQPSAWLYVTCR